MLKHAVQCGVIYLDHNATTRPCEAAVSAARRAMELAWGNPSSVHRAGQAARREVELARASIADLIGATAREITFTSSGTEAIALGVRGVLSAGGPRRLMTTAIEHAAVRELAEDLARRGEAEVVNVPVSREGRIDPAAFAAALARGGLACVAWANNETGAIQPVAAIAAACRAAKVPLLLDATQWVGKMPTRVREGGTLACDLMVFSPHKFHGLKGVGCLWAHAGVRLRPQMPGSQELGRRGGTENVPGIAGAGAAAREAAAWLARPGERDRLAAMRDRFERAVLAACPGAAVNGPAARLWNTTNIAFPRLEAEALLLRLSERGVCASAGAACSSGSLEPSPVLLAMGVPPELAHGSLRFSLSRETTDAEIDAAATEVIAAAAALRAALPG